ncbi:hypothetical protein OROMI_001212 [Orobanche minor]
MSWNHHLFSTGGRLELINSVLNSIALYSLQVLKPPGNVIIFLERLFNKFLCGSNDNKRKLHWAAWNRLCFPTEEGGIGCRDINDIIKAAEIKLCNNGKASFWHDKWCDLGPLSNFKQTKSKDTINYVWTNGDWDRRKINRILPIGLSEHICSYPTTPLVNKPSWTLSANGNFSFKTSWELLRKNKHLHNILPHCWNAFITPTISVFMVRLVNKWIPMPDGLHTSNINFIMAN